MAKGINKSPNWPSTTGNKSGGGRDNNPPKPTTSSPKPPASAPKPKVR